MWRTSHSETPIRIRISDEADMRPRREKQMNRNQLEQQCKSVEAQMRWAELHGGDQELLDLLNIERDRLFAVIGQCHSQASTAA
jgi:3-deoxy-D-arabino-heptulosonate 7-phosphate (DAHP) synthase